MNPDGEYSMFEYLYRDAGNYKTHGRVLLRGRVLTEDDAAIRRALDDDTFNPDAVGLPSLHAQHWRDCGSEFAAELDHPLHELTALRAARPDEIEGLSADGSIAQLTARFRALGAHGRGAGESYPWLDDPPDTCPRCGRRSEWDERGDGVPRHTCNNPDAP